MKRLYVSGTIWCVWRWTYTPSAYITRLHIVKTPWFAVCLHWLNKPDEERHLHDHPVSFLSIILSGNYLELRKLPNREAALKQRSYINFVKASPADCHRVVRVGQNTITLVFTGPKVREWGFHTAEGWVHWKKYNKETYGQEAK